MAQIRGVFPLPQSGPAIAGNPNAVCLPSGGIHYPFAGEYLLTTGGQTVLQWFNPNTNSWVDLAGPETVQQISVDGTNYRLVNMSGVVVAANITNAGSGGVNGIGPVQTGSTVTFAAAGGATAAQGYVVVGGSVPAPTVTNAGSGFTVPPVIACDPPPIGGVQATFTCTLTAGGGINTVTQQSAGAGYTSIPNFYIIPQQQFFPGGLRYPGDTPFPTPGNVIPPVAPGLINPANAWGGSPFAGNLASGTIGAQLTGNALTGSGTLTAIVMTYYGQLYTGNNVPAISFGGQSLGAAAATAIMSFCMTAASGGSVTATGGTSGVVGSAVITSLGLIAGANNNNSFFARPSRGIATSAAGVYNMEDPGFGLQGGAVVENLQGSTTLATVTNTQYGGRPDTSILQPMSQ